MRKLAIIISLIFLGIIFIDATEGWIQNVNQTGNSNSHTLREAAPAPKCNLPSSSLAIKPDFGKIPLYFIPNRGQADRKALFYAKTSRYTLWVTRDRLNFDSVRTTAGAEGEPMEEFGTEKCRHQHGYEREVTSVQFHNSNKTLEIIPLGRSEHRANYFIRSDSSRWQTNLPTFQAILYKGIYKNIDLRVYGVEREVEYDWVVKPGGAVEGIQFEYQGVKETRINEGGDLIVRTELGELIHRKPVFYQVIEGRRVDIEGGYRKRGENIYGFEVREYDRRVALIIDPVVLVYSTYFGGSAGEEGRGVAADSTGTAYVTGYTCSGNFPTKNAYDKTFNGGQYDVFVTKFAVSGNGSSLSHSPQKKQ
jgi:hypothetical protein